MELRDYQESICNKGLDILRSYKILYLAMEVRTGKTITALSISERYGARNILFVTKKKAIPSIEKDAMHFSLNITIINYESVEKRPGQYDLIIIDEAHSLGAFPKPSNRTKVLKKMAARKPIIFLSGTPAPESHSQLYHQFWVSDYSPFSIHRNFYSFAHEYVAKKTKYVYNREIADYSCAKMEAINKSTDHLFLAYTQKEAGFTVEIEEVILHVDMNKSQQYCIEKLLKDRVLYSKNGDPILADTNVKLQSKIHQICSGSLKDENGKIHHISDSKAQFIKSYFKGKKIVVFYKFVGEFEILKSVLEDFTTDPMEFQNTSSKTFLGQFVSSREGIRLDTADAIIFYNIDFSYLSYEQAKNRIMSLERSSKATLYWVFSNGGIEPKIYRAVKNKKDYTTYFFRKDYLS